MTSRVFSKLQLVSEVITLVTEQSKMLLISENNCMKGILQLGTLTACFNLLKLYLVTISYSKYA